MTLKLIRAYEIAFFSGVLVIVAILFFVCSLFVDDEDLPL